MKDLKFLILLAYYQRPKIVLNALRSLKDSTYKNFNVSFIDDSGDDSFMKTFQEYGLDNHSEYIPINQSVIEKREQGGSIYGKYLNEACARSDADVVIFLCDDDAITPEYLGELNDYYKANPESLWSYCHVVPFNPVEGLPNNLDAAKNFYLNRHAWPINPYCNVDASQVSFRRQLVLDHGFPYPLTKCLDAGIYEKIHPAIGDCPFNGTIGQYKGWFSDQLGNRQQEFNVGIE